MGFVNRRALIESWYVDEPFGQSAPSVCGVSGSPSMSMILPSLT
jgi:hypothetical protein